MPQSDPIEVHVNTRDCEPMQPETAVALGRAFQAVHKQLSDPATDPRATLEPVTAEEMEKAADVFDNFNRNSRTVILLRAGAAAIRDRDAAWAAADALAGAIDSIQWNCGCCEDVAECANCKRCELARAAYTAARAKRTT